MLCCIALAVKLSSPGPVIFRQTRYGMDGKPIKVWKFRSMKVMEKRQSGNSGDAERSARHQSGNFLRRTSLDELPQFINVLTGGCRLSVHVHTRWRITNSIASSLKATCCAIR
ncbi:sugar transferase [Escherichia coli]|nr:sugar transferase [Escherichia coli]